MIRTFCLQYEKDWDDGVHLLLFAAREAVQESLGFSPFELVFGHTVRGPLKLVKEKWLDEHTDLNLLDYVSNSPSNVKNLTKAFTMAGVLIFRNGIASGKRVEVHIIVSKY
jgi:hypothetical protein